MNNRVCLVIASLLFLALYAMAQPGHHRESPNIIFSDKHVEWVTSPLATTQPSTQPATQPALQSAEAAAREEVIAQEDNIREAALRYLFAHNASALQQNAAAYFISIDGKDPSDEFIKRFADSKIPVKKASQAGKGEGSRVIDPDTNKPALKFNVGPVQWILEIEATIPGGYYEGNLSASQATYRLVKEEGRWVVKEKVGPEAVS